MKTILVIPRIIVNGEDVDVLKDEDDEKIVLSGRMTKQEIAELAYNIGGANPPLPVTEGVD